MREITVIASILLAGFAQAAEPVLGEKPDYVSRPISEAPNAEAFSARAWAPGLDRGYTPQGLAVVGGRVHVVGYREDGCRIFAMDRRGAVTSETAVPGCRHGGGLAVLRDGRLVVIDTRALFVIRGGRVIRRIVLDSSLTGSFGEADGNDLWIGRYVREGQGRLWRLPGSFLDRDRLSEADASETLDIPGRAQGMAIGGGGIWLTFSGSRYGELARIDRASGRPIARYDMPAGIEDIAFDSAGMLWAVSEAGAKKYVKWPTNFPLVFAIDPARLR